MTYFLPSVHGSKLKVLLENPKLPIGDKPKIARAIAAHEAWRNYLFSVDGPRQDMIRQMVALLNEYKLNLDLAFIFDSEDDFLYRQKGQLKLDSTVIEEFLPIFITKTLNAELAKFQLNFGAHTCFSSIHFDSSIVDSEAGGGLRLREKDHDFVIGRDVFIQSSHHEDFSESIIKKTMLAYVAVECKTNLDKTMFQEAAATALDLKMSVPSAKYYLVCEWLDMIPINSGTTAIDEVIILRKARRLSAEIRNRFNTSKGRRELRSLYEKHLIDHPYAIDMFERLANHIQNLVSARSEDDILEKGHF